ncbi:transcriptional regulator with XRE-family HTH domain [Paraburkholderia atlantica]
MRLANHLGVASTEVYNWRSGRVNPSLPRLVLIAYCCGCSVADVVLGNSVMLRKVFRSRGHNLLVTRQRRGAAATHETLLAELDWVFESGSALNLCQAARLLDVSESYLRKLAPDVAEKLVQRGRETRRRKKIQREEARFEDFWRSFQQLRLEDIYPAEDKVKARMYQRTGTKLGYLEGTRFHKKALVLAGDFASMAPPSLRTTDRD